MSRSRLPGRTSSSVLVAFVAAVLVASTPVRATGAEAQARIASDLAAGRPLVVHVIVALCDNQHQGIVPVSPKLGDGQDPQSNLYWGALYGLRTFFGREGGWTRLSVGKSPDARILDRVAFVHVARRSGHPVPVYLVADAWDGAEIRSAIERFLMYAAGGGAEKIAVVRDSQEVDLAAGGSAHLVAFVGHDGLMDFQVSASRTRDKDALPNSSIVLACDSRLFFLDRLHSVGSQPVLLTNGLMAPEAYTLDAAIRSWASGGSVAEVCEAAAAAYQRYQHCGLSWARTLFWCESP